MALLLVELRAEAVKLLSILGLLVTFSGGAFPGSFFMVQTGDVSIDLQMRAPTVDLPFAMLLLPPLDIPMLVNLEVSTPE